MACGCFQGLFGGSSQRKPSAVGPLLADVVASPGASKRRFEPAGEVSLTVDEVFDMVRPRPSPAAKPLQVQQSWASPVQTKIELTSSLEDIDEQRELKKNISFSQAEQFGLTPGSLPPPLSAAQRERVIRKLLPTATHDLLAKLPRDLVEAQTKEGQTLRRRLVNGATIVFFTAGYPGKRFVFERAAQLGAKTVVIEHPDSWAKDLLQEGLISKFIPIDMGRPSDEVLADSIAAIKNLGNDGITGEADAVLTVVELSMPLVARMCEQLGLPGPSPEAVGQARDKHATRKALKANNLATPRTFLIERPDQAAEAARVVGFPAVLKPVSGAASLGVKKVSSQAEMMKCYTEVVNELKNLVVVSGALQQASANGGGVRADQVVNIAVLMEQYLDGKEVDIDVVMSDGEYRYAAVTDNGPTVEPYFNETWGVCPSLLPLDQQRELKDYGVACTKALGFTDGVFHVECRYTSTGPQLIEVNARMGGGPVHEHNLRVWGVDLVEEALFVALGIPARPFVPKMPIEPVAYYLIPCMRSGIVKALPNFDAIKALPGVIWARPMCAVGEKVVGPEEGLPTWMWDIMVKGSTGQAALDYVFKLEAENQVQIG